MNNFIIIDQNQFGYHTGNYHYCKYLRDRYNCIYICWDHGLTKIEMNSVRVVYVSRKGNILMRTHRFVSKALQEIKDKRSIIFIKYFKVVALILNLFRRRQCLVLDIRTGSVSKNLIVRYFQNEQLKFEARFFKHVTIISKSLAEKLGIAHKAHILPLGADVISPSNKDFKSLNLLYVGTLYNRNIEVAIKGFDKFYNEFRDKISVTFTIIGGGANHEEKKLQDIVSYLRLADIVKIKGPIPYTNLKPYFDTSNIGVSYIPLTDYYDVQPPTKTFEYLLSGMPVVATHTYENKRVVSCENGVLIGDSEDEFYRGLKLIVENKDLFNSDEIRQSNINYKWENIVQSNMKIYLKKISNSKK